MKILNKLTSKREKIIAVVMLIIAFIYDVSPVDVIPDIIPFTGWIDDIFVTLIIIFNTYLKFKSRKNNKK